MAQESIFPQMEVIRTPRVVKVLCECFGSVASTLSFLPSEPLAPHGDHIPNEKK